MDPLSAMRPVQMQDIRPAAGSGKEEQKTGQDVFIRDRAVPKEPSLMAMQMQAPAVSGLEAVKDAGQSAPALPRTMTEEEKASFREYFPKLDVDKAVVTAEATPQYNCISWTVGETNQWFWPPEMYPNVSPEKAFDRFYARYGLRPAEEGEVAHWADANGPTHGSISGPGHGPRWESKCGEDLRIEHGRDELESDIYGKIVKYYTKQGGPEPVAAHEEPEIPQRVFTVLSERKAKLPDRVKEEFAKHYEDWMTFRHQPRVRMSGNPADYCKTEAFNKIVGMGSKIMPLLMEKIAHGDFFSYQACKAIEKKESAGEFKIAMAPSHRENNAVSEQTRALRALMNWQEKE